MKSARMHLWITGAILIALGFMTMRYPVEAIMSAGMIIGIGLAVSGVNHFSAWYFFGMKRFIVMGIIDLIAGIIMITQPGITAFLIPFVIGIWLLTEGISRICSAFWLGGAEIPGWWVMLLSGLALIAFGVLVCASPLVISLSVMMVIAWSLVVYGVLAVIEGFAIPR